MHIIFDIETVPAASCQNDPALRDIIKQGLNKRWKEETKEAHMEEYVAKMSLDPGTAQVCAIVAKVEDEIFSMATQDEINLLQSFHAFLNGQPDHIHTFVGFNIRRFDLPVLAAAYMRRGLPVPSPIAIAMSEGHRYSIDYYAMFNIGLQKFAQALGMEPLAVSGADVWDLFKAGDMEAIKRHCEDDVWIVWDMHKAIHG